MSEKKPSVVVDANHKKCPVCGRRSYSHKGIHPQCAMLQADTPRRESLALQKKEQQLNKVALATAAAALEEPGLV